MDGVVSVKATDKQECVVLGCTDFHLVYDHSQDFEFVDTMEVLAQATIREMLSD